MLVRPDEIERLEWRQLIKLAICVLLIVAFVHIMRHAQHLGRKMEWVGAFNYITAAAASCAWWALGKGAGPGWEEAVFGSILGLVLVIGFFLLDSCIRIAGVAISQTVERLSSVLLPVAASIVIWKESPGPLRAAGLALAVASLPLLAQGPSAKPGPYSRWRAASLLFWLLFVTGCGGVSLKAYDELTGSQLQPSFFLFAFAAAALVNAVYAIIKGRVPSVADIAEGAVLGIVNLVSNFFYLLAVAALPGTVVFPTVAAGVILVSSVAAAFIWKERYGTRALLGMAVAGIALVLINL